MGPYVGMTTLLQYRHNRLRDRINRHIALLSSMAAYAVGQRPTPDGSANVCAAAGGSLATMAAIRASSRFVLATSLSCQHRSLGDDSWPARTNIPSVPGQRKTSDIGLAATTHNRA
jgi:hypothetical protein